MLLVNEGSGNDITWSFRRIDNNPAAAWTDFSANAAFTTSGDDLTAMATGHGRNPSTHELRARQVDASGTAIFVYFTVNVAGEATASITSASIAGTNLVFTFDSDVPSGDYVFRINTSGGTNLGWNYNVAGNTIGVRDTATPSSTFSVGETVTWTLTFAGDDT